MEKNALLEFGKMIISARDDIFDEISRVGEDNCVLPNIFKKGEDLDSVKDFSDYIVDRFIFKLMNGIEEMEFSSEYKLEMTKDGATYDIANISDGLAGEFMTSNGWFARLSRHGSTPLLESNSD